MQIRTEVAAGLGAGNEIFGKRNVEKERPVDGFRRIGLYEYIYITESAVSRRAST